MTAWLLPVLLSLAAANTQLQNAETEVNIKPNGQLGEASVSFVRLPRCATEQLPRTP